jgi:fluoride exporter
VNSVMVALGGAIGALSRYLLGVWIGKRVSFQAVPLPMIIVNWLGSLGLGIVTALAAKYEIEEPLGLTVGFFGAFTTFSTFSVEAVELFMKKEYVRAIIYIVASICGSVSFFFAAYLLIKPV